VTPRISADSPPDADLRALFARVRVIAVFGASPNPARPSNDVLRFLIARGFEIFPVNPGVAGQEIARRRVYGRLADIPVAIDMVDVFRNSAAAGGVVDEALALSLPPQVIWMQLGIRDEAAAERARARGVVVIMNRCAKTEIRRLPLA
jgi:predicted CoA-binding protein